MGHKQETLQLLIVILPDVKGYYGKIKRPRDTDLGIVTQCCEPININDFSNAYLDSLVLKLNVKTGGANYVLDTTFLGDKPTIIFGANVTHPANDSGPSIAAVVASMDWPGVSTYKCRLAAQGNNQEIIADLYKAEKMADRGVAHGGMIRELLLEFQSTVGFLPERIIFYRDGVGEHRYDKVKSEEVKAVQEACKSIKEGYEPRITFVLVHKRHHTRLFPARRNKSKTGNVLPA